MPRTKSVVGASGFTHLGVVLPSRLSHDAGWCFRCTHWFENRSKLFTMLVPSHWGKVFSVGESVKHCRRRPGGDAKGLKQHL